MKKLFNFLPRDSIVRWGFSIAFIFLVLSLILPILAYQILPPFLPIYNKMPWGYARVGTKNEFFIPIAIGVFFYFFNLFFSVFVYKQIALLGRFISATTVAISFITCIFVLQIILLVK